MYLPEVLGYCRDRDPFDGLSLGETRTGTSRWGSPHGVVGFGVYHRMSIGAAIGNPGARMAFLSGPGTDEHFRLAEFQRYEVRLDQTDPALVDLARLAASLTASPIAGVSLVDSNHVWIKGAVGIDGHCLEREGSFCGAAVESNLPLFSVPDAARHPVFASNPLVVSAPNIRSYAAAVLIGQSGYALGTLWVMHHEPRSLTAAERENLIMLSAHVVRLLELRHRHAVTGLPTRQAFVANLQCALDQQRLGSQVCRVADCRRLRPDGSCSSEDSQRATAVGCVRLRNLPLINSVHTRDAGLAVLRALSLRLLGWLGEGNTLGHFEDDNFTFALFDSPLAVRRRLDALPGILAAPVPFGPTVIRPDITIGVVDPNKTPISASALVDRVAVPALHGEHRYPSFPGGHGGTDANRVWSEVQRTLPQDLSTGRIRPHYQPQVDVLTGTLWGFEALARLDHATLGEVAAGDLLSVATDENLLFELDLTMLEAVCADLAGWLAAGLALVPVSANLARSSLRRPGAAHEILSCLSRHGVPPELLKIEITEGGPAAPLSHLSAAVEELHEARLTVVLDDFGTGLSNLEMLGRVPITVLKADRFYVHGASTSPHIEGLLRFVHNIAALFGLGVICEGIEEEADLQVAVELGCRYFQGWYFGAAVPAERATAMLQWAATPRGHLMPRELAQALQSC